MMPQVVYFTFYSPTKIGYIEYSDKEVIQKSEIASVDQAMMLLAKLVRQGYRVVGYTNREILVVWEREQRLR